MYAPTGNIANTNNFFKNILGSILKEVRKKEINNIILRGDWNATMNNNKDRWTNYAKRTNKVIFKGLEEFIKKNNLIDIWCKNNENKREFTWEKVALQNEKKEREQTEISSMRLDFFVTTKKISESKITHSNIIKNNFIRTDHKVIWISIKNPWNNTKENEIEQENIVKINTKGRNKDSKIKIEKWFKNNYDKNINKEISNIHNKYNYDKLNEIIEKINNIIYLVCEKVYGIKENTKHKDFKEKNKELGITKKSHKRISKCINIITKIVRNNECNIEKVSKNINRIIQKNFKKETSKWIENIKVLIEKDKKESIKWEEGLKILWIERNSIKNKIIKKNQ